MESRNVSGGVPDRAEPAAASSRRRGDEAHLEALIVTLLPWLLSILLHAAIVLLAVFVVWSSVTELTGGTYRFISAAQIGLHRP